MTRSKIAALLVVMAAFPFTVAFVGGWATITVDTLPDYIVTQRPTNITFSVRQHGMRLLRDLEPRIEARQGANQITARAVPTNREGYYTATVNLPQTGDWTLTIRSGFGPSDVTLLPIPAVSAVRNVASVMNSDRGRQLFVAKGCVTCHVHAQVENSGKYKTGPDLTERGLQRTYLERFLADPSVKKNWTTDARMPNLNLKDEEITWLIAFLNNEPGRHEVAAGK